LHGCQPIEYNFGVELTTMSGAGSEQGPIVAPRLRATMREVAALAGVSLKTVSRVVNNEAGVAPAVRERVQAALVRLDYRPNLAASNLRRAHGRTATIGALLQNLSNSFSSSLLRAIEDGARGRGLAVLAASLDEEPERERALVADLVARRVDALVLMPATEDQEYLAAERRAGLPTVFVDSVTVDNHGGAVDATRHLLRQGHRRIAYLGDLAHIQTARDRLDGYTSALRASGLEPDPRLVLSGVRSTDAARTALVSLLHLPDPPTAVFASRNVLAIGAVHALRDTGCSDHVALVGFDDFPLADLISPPLTVVRQDVARIGATVCQLVFERLDGDTSPAREVRLPTTLVVRGSGEIPPHPR
jgi:LacI family transcriptional regulator